MTRENTRCWLIQYNTMGFDPLDTDKWLIMQAYSDGADIEWSSKGENEWHNASDPAWHWGICDYRIKPAPVRPYTIYELAEELARRKSPEIIQQGFNIKREIEKLSFHSETHQVCIWGTWYSLNSLMQDFIWPDGTPCGVKR